MVKRIALAVAIGTLTTAALMVLSFVADSSGFTSLASGLFWQNSLLQNLAPLGNVGTPAHPTYEGSPLNFFAFLVSIVVGVILYGLVAYVALSWRGGAPNQSSKRTREKPRAA